MKTFNHVLPHRDEITVELLEGNVVQLTQANPSLDQPDQIKIHADDLPMLIDALTRVSNVAKAEF